MRATTEMMDALEGLSPQLEINDYELYQTIKYFKGGRDVYGFDNASLDHDLDVAILDAEEGNSAELDRILAQEEQSYESIDRCLAEFRAFIIREIPFRESF
jgi:hypothetical protein